MPVSAKVYVHSPKINKNRGEYSKQNVYVMIEQTEIKRDILVLDTFAYLSVRLYVLFSSRFSLFHAFLLMNKRFKCNRSVSLYFVIHVLSFYCQSQNAY